MTIEYQKFNIASFEKEVLVTVEFTAADLDEAKALIDGCRSLGARGTTTQETTKPKDKKAKPEKAKPAPEPEEDDEEEDEEDDEEEESKPAKKGKSKSADKEEDEDDEEEDDDDEEEEDEDEESDDEEDEDEEDDEEEEKPKKSKGKEKASGGKLPQIKLTKEMTKPDYRFRDVIKSLIDQGVTKKADLIRVCEKIKEQVPCVAKVSDMSDRVSRAAEMLGVDIS